MRCPMCGYNDAPEVTLTRNEMNRYVNDKDPKDIIVFNSIEPKITIGKDKNLQTYTREDMVGKVDKDVKPVLRPIVTRTTDRAGTSTSLPPAQGAPLPQQQG